MRRPWQLVCATIAVLATTAAPLTAFANDGTPTDVPPPPSPGQPGQIVIDTPGERSTANVVTLGVMSGVGLLIGGLGAYYNVQANSDASDLGNARIIGVTWDAAHQAKEDQLHSYNTDAVVAYSIGGALLIGAAVALILTVPQGSTTIIHPHSTTEPVIAPTSGGAVFGERWSF